MRHLRRQRESLGAVETGPNPSRRGILKAAWPVPTPAPIPTIGFCAEIDRVSINDLHATILQLLGIYHKRLTYKYNGRDSRLTDVAGNVAKAVVG